MASKETLKIAFTTGGILPASIMSAKKDQRVAARVPCDVPADYARQLIDDKFAYLYEDDEDDSAAWAKAQQLAADKKAAEETAAKAQAEKDAADKKAAEEAAAAKAAADANGQNKA